MRHQRPKSNISSVAATADDLVAVNASNTNNLNDQGIFRSVDGGGDLLAYSGVAAGLPLIAANAVVADPTTAGVITWRRPTSTSNAIAGFIARTTAALRGRESSSRGWMRFEFENQSGRLSVSTPEHCSPAWLDNGALAGIFRTTDQGSTGTNFGVPTTSRRSGADGDWHSTRVDRGRSIFPSQRIRRMRCGVRRRDRQPLGGDYGRIDPNSLDE